MRILLIGNFAPPYEEENLHNLSFLKKLEEDGHECSVINISENPSNEEKIVDAKSLPVFVLKLLRNCRKKDVVHFSTKGYLRLGLLKLMTSILVGKFFRIKSIITFHSELFSILGQMRSPFGGTQTLFTTFFFADKIIFADRDTYNVATMYMKKSNFELIPSFIYTPEDIKENESLTLKKLKDKEKVIVFANVKYPSFLFEILQELLTNYPLPSGAGIVISLSEKPAGKLQHAIEETGRGLADNLVFIAPDDIRSILTACSRADIILRPLSCEGATYFESFSVSVRKTMHSGNYIYFPGGLVFVREGKTAEMCVKIINTLLSAEPDTIPELKAEDSYKKIIKIYQE
ncbi:MAG TPA: glycosyltransferase family 1 protein [Nitrospirae bacterium]|nr:glycosyltransferase family 1 protein [Nitrospirota bacterium]